MKERLFRKLGLVASLLCLLVAGVYSLSSKAAWHSVLQTVVGAGGGGPTGMVTPILAFGGCNSVIVNTANNWAFPASGSISGQGCWATPTTISGRGVPMPIAGTITNLYVNFGVTAGSYTIGVSKAYTTTPTLKCLIDSANNPTSNYACSDTSGSVSVVAGDIIALIEQPAPSSTTTNVIPISFTFTSTGTSQEQPLFWGWVGATGSSTAALWYAVGTGSIASSTDLAASSIIPTAGTIDNLYVQQASTSATGVYAYFLYKNGAQQAGLTCTVAVGQSTCNSIAAGTNTAVHFNAGDTASLEVCPAAAASLDGACPVGTAPSAAVQVRGSLRWVPDVAGEAIVVQRSSTMPSSGATRYVALSGAGLTADSSDGFDWNIAPVGFTVKKFWHAQDSSGTRQTTVRTGALSIPGTPGNTGTPADTALTCALTTLTIGGVAGTNGCQDITHSASVPLAGFVAIGTVPVSNTVSSYFKNSAVVTVP